MTELQRFRDFVNERLAIAAMEIIRLYAERLEEQQEAIRRLNKESVPLKLLQPQIKLHRIDAQPRSLPEPPTIKEEEEPWIGAVCQIKEEQELPCVSTQTAPPVFSSQTKEESDGEVFGKLLSDNDFQPPAVPPDCAIEWSPQAAIEWSTPADWSRSMTSPSSSTESALSSNLCTDSRLGPSPCSSPTASSCTGSESEDLSSGEDESLAEENSRQRDKRNKAFRRASNFTINSSIKTTLYQCQDCDKAFTQPDKLAYHRRIHHKPYICTICGRGFEKMSGLKTHERIHRVHISFQKVFNREEELFQCETCGEAFSCGSQLFVHSQFHNDPSTWPPPVPLLEEHCYYRR